MKIEEFQSGVFRQQFQYRSFSPVPVNILWTWESPEINILLAEANRLLGELNAFGKILPDVDKYIEMHVLAEANASSRIEGTQIDIETAALREADINPEHRDDWREVHNYVKAMNYAVDGLAQIPLSNRLLKSAHGILLKGVRGRFKTPGEFRTSQNWIGGSSLSDAVFIPPEPNEVPALMSDLEKFWHNDDIHVPHLIRVAISHYQFETIHPFQDGNGRIGRLMITLYLINYNLLTKPCFYISDFLEKNRSAYYDALMAVRTRHDLAHWVKFFLNAVIVTAQQAVLTFQSILELKESLNKKTLSLGRRAHNAQSLLALFYRHPYLSPQEISAKLKLTPPTTNTLLEAMEAHGILQEVTGYQRNRIFCFKPYLDLFRRRSSS